MRCRLVTVNENPKQKRILDCELPSNDGMLESDFYATGFIDRPDDWVLIGVCPVTGSDISFKAKNGTSLIYARKGGMAEWRKHPKSAMVLIPGVPNEILSRIPDAVAGQNSKDPKVIVGLDHRKRAGESHDFTLLSGDSWGFSLGILIAVSSKGFFLSANFYATDGKPEVKLVSTEALPDEIVGVETSGNKCMIPFLRADYRSFKRAGVFLKGLFDVFPRRQVEGVELLDACELNRLL
jgi:hypothetical protein